MQFSPYAHAIALFPTYSNDGTLSPMIASARSLRATLPVVLAVVVVTSTLGLLVGWKLFAAAPPRLVQITADAKAVTARDVANFNPAAIFRYRDPGTVAIESVAGAVTIGGSGFVIDAQGHIVTASHVVVDYSHGGTIASSIYVDIGQNNRVMATIVGIDRFSDLAVLKVDPGQVELHPVPWGDSDAVLPGEPVAAIGAPFGYEHSITKGIVSAVHRTVRTQVSDSSIADAIQIDVPINHGNSGGPVFNARGEVIGIAQQIRSTTNVSEGVGFAVPSDTARRSAQQIIEGGRPHYAMIGLSTTTVSPQLAQQQHLGSPTGVLVTQASGPAATAGMSAGSQAVLFAGKTVQLGDELIRLGGAQVVTSDDVPRIVSHLAPGDAVTAVWYHGSVRHTGTIVAAERNL